jgi:hypothetical protein
MNTRKALACFGPHAGTRFELQPLADGAPKAGEIEVARRAMAHGL